MTRIDLAVLGLYFPIVVFSGWALWLYLARVLYPAIQRRVFSLRDHALVVAIALALAADLSENLYYGTARLDAEWYFYLTNALPAVGLGKGLILAAAVFAVAGYKKAVYGEAKLSRLVLFAFLLWVASALFWVGWLGRGFPW